MDGDEISTIFDVDNHYWAPSDAFTRYRNPKFADRGVIVLEIDGRTRYVVHGEPHPWIPGPGDVTRVLGQGRSSTISRERAPRPTSFDDGYREVEDEVARAWGYPDRRRQGAVSSLVFYEPLVEALMHNRLIHDFVAALITHGLFERHPTLRLASIENGVTWVSDLSQLLRRLHGQNPGMFKKNPVDQLHEHVWIAPFVEETVLELAKYLPVERILFGSDWPHAEGVPHPRDFLQNVAGFSLEEQRRIIRDNARELVPSSRRDI